jgi:hypothetical protein
MLLVTLGGNFSRERERERDLLPASNKYTTYISSQMTGNNCFLN